MKEVIDFEFCFREGDFFAAEFVFEFDEFILEFYPPFALVVKISLQFLLGFPELVAFVLEHELDLSDCSVVLKVV